MRDRDVLLHNYEQFLKVLRDQQLENIGNIADQDSIFSFSIMANDQDLIALHETMQLQSEINVRRVKSSNIIIRHNKTKAVLSAYALFLYGVDNGKSLYPFEFGGKFLVTFEKQEDWKITKVQFDLDWEKGNTMYVPHWNLIDYTMYAGHPLQIVSEFDAAWVQITDAIDERTEEEKCQELFAQYAWGVDQADWRVLLDTWASDVVSIMPRGNLNGQREFLKDIKKTRFKEATMQHACKITGIDVHGDHAVMKAYRMEPHRLGSKVLHRGNIDQNFYSASYDLTLCKEEGNWKFKEVFYHGGVFFEAEDREKILVDQGGTQ